MKLNELVEKHSKTIVISFASPYVYNELKHPALFICTYSQSEVSQISCVEALFGEIPFEGLLPVSLDRHHCLSQPDKSELKRRGLL
jgi:hypothetical protein